MMECGHSHWEQHDDGPGHMILICLVCGHQQHLKSHYEDGEDKWRDIHDDDEY